MRLADATEQWLAERRRAPASALLVHRDAPEARALARRLAAEGCEVSEAPPRLLGSALRRRRQPPRALVVAARPVPPRLAAGANSWPLWQAANVTEAIRAAAAAEGELRRAGPCQILLLARALPGGAAQLRLAEQALRRLLGLLGDALGPLARVNALVRGPGDDALRVSATAEAMLADRMLRQELVWHGRP